MTISERQQLLLNKLNDAHEPLTAKVLSQLLSVSSKTIRNDITQINQSFISPVIESKIGTGYFLNESQQLTEWLTKKTTENRPFELLRYLINHGKTNFYDLAEEFFISESTLTRIVKTLNTMIAQKDQTLCIIRKNNELLIEGEEEKKRQLFNLFLHQEIENYQLSLDKYIDYFDHCDLKKLSAVIISYHQANELVLNDFATISFILHIAVLIERVSIGNYIQRMPLKKGDKKSQDMAQQLTNRLEKELEISIPSQELTYIARLYSGKLHMDSTVDEHDLTFVVLNLLESVKHNFYIDFSIDEKMSDYLLNHLAALYKRAIHKQYLTNPLTEELKNKFPFIYNVSVYASAFIQKELAITFPDDEIAYIALHFLSASETINHGKKRKILLVCPYGTGGQRLAYNKLKKISTFSIDLVVAQSIFDHHRFFEEEEIHLIVTSETLAIETTIPIYPYDLLLTDHDLQNIQQLLEKQPEAEALSENFFKEELFFPQQEFKTREEVISFLCQQLTTFDYCNSDYEEKVFEREELSSTSYGNYYAIPHAIQRSAKKNAVAVCSLDKPIEWGNNRVRLVLLLAMKKERDNSFEELFSQLVKILNDGNFVKKLARQTAFLPFIQLCDQ